MRFTKTDPQLGELVVETSSKAEALQLRASGYQQQDDDGAAAEEPDVPARRKERTPRPDAAADDAAPAAS